MGSLLYRLFPRLLRLLLEGPLGMSLGNKMSLVYNPLLLPTWVGSGKLLQFPMPPYFSMGWSPTSPSFQVKSQFTNRCFICQLTLDLSLPGDLSPEELQGMQ